MQNQILILHIHPSTVNTEQLHYLTASGYTLCYQKHGHGADTLLLFHGFGQDHSAFNPLASVLDKHYTCYSVDLFFHGQSHWNAGEQPITPAQWKTIIQCVLEKENIARFSLLGYSMGARFALCTFEAMPQMVNEIFLIAPAGISRDRWYALATSTRLMRAFFKSMVRHGHLFSSINKWLMHVKLLNPRTYRFAESQMNSTEKRAQVYYSWVVFRKMEVPINQLAGLLNRHKPRLVILTGTKDTIIDETKIAPLITKLHYPVIWKHADVSHHHLLRKEVAAKLFEGV